MIALGIDWGGDLGCDFRCHRDLHNNWAVVVGFGCSDFGSWVEAVDDGDD